MKVIAVLLTAFVIEAYGLPAIDEDDEFVIQKLKRDDLIPNITVTIPAESPAPPHELSSDDTVPDPLESRSRKVRDILHRTGPDCSDTRNVRVSGMTCKQVFDRVGARGCHHPVLQQHCCGTRRMYCETCLRNTPGIQFLGGKTCDQLLSESTRYCNNYQVIYHCCVSRTQYCPCSADVRGASFFHSEALFTTPTCANIFTLGELSEQCSHPNLKEKCCKTRKSYCSTEGGSCQDKINTIGLDIDLDEM